MNFKFRAGCSPYCGSTEKRRAAGLCQTSQKHPLSRYRRPEPARALQKKRRGRLTRRGALPVFRFGAEPVVGLITALITAFHPISIGDLRNHGLWIFRQFGCYPYRGNGCRGNGIHLGNRFCRGRCCLTVFHGFHTRSCRFCGTRGTRACSSFLNSGVACFLCCGSLCSHNLPT